MSASKAKKTNAEAVSATTLTDPTPVTAKGGKTAQKRKSAEETNLEIRKLHFPGVEEGKLWLLDGKRGGFAQVPRTLSLFSEVIIKHAVKKKTGVSSAAGSTYNVLWLHTKGQGISKIEYEEEAALEAGYGGERGISTFRKHMRVLKDLGFIDYVEESRGRVRWVLMLNPYLVLKDLLSQGLVDKRHYAAMVDRLSSIGSSGELKEAEDDAE